MREFGWMRLAGLFLVLTVLAALARMGGGAEARSLTAQLPDTMAFSESHETPAPLRWTEARLSALEDMRSAPRPPEGTAPGLADLLPPEGSARTNDGGGKKGPTAEPPVPEPNARAVPATELPVFYRPADPTSEAAPGPVCSDLRGASRDGKIVFPLERRFFYSYEDTWGAPRAQGGHEGTDLMTPSGAPEYAITDGTVVPVAGSNAGGWNTLGGHAVMVRADYSIGPIMEGDLFYYAHLERRSPLQIGSKVRAGQVVGYAGDTGQGPPGTSGLFPPHLHLGWYDGTGGRKQATSGAMNPYPLLEWIRSNGGTVSGGSEARFCEAPRTGPPTPSVHDGAWPTSSNPDLDTGPKKRNASNEEINRDSGKPDRTERDDRDRRGKPEKEDRKTNNPDRPERDPKRPGANDDRNPPSNPGRPQKPGPPSDPGEPDEHQYEPATGGETAPPDRPSRPKKDKEPKPDEEGDAGKNAGNDRKGRNQP